MANSKEYPLNGGVRGSIDQLIGGGQPPRTDDPAWQPPRDPMADGKDARARAGTIYREISISTIQTDYSVSDVRAALSSHNMGIFDLSAQLVDAMMGDDRVQATLGSRTGGLFGRPVRFKPANDSRAAKEVYDAWREAWPTMAPEAVLSEIQRWAIMLGFHPSQILWDTSKPIWVPHLTPWHPRWTFYHLQYRCYVATTMDSLKAIVPGDGKWFLHAPGGAYRGWMRAAMRAVAQPWLMRAFAYRDWARYCERHGMPFILAKTPAAGDPIQRAEFEASMANLGQETTVLLPQGVDEHFSYDLEILEAKDRSWEAFPGLIDRCDMSIVLAILFQNLTTEVKEGSFAAARQHGDVRQGAIEADNSSLRMSLYSQLARPFAALNFGDPDLAPWTDWDVQPTDDKLTMAALFRDFGAAVQTLRQGGVQFADEAALQKLAATFGIDLPAIKLVDPTLVAAKKDEAT